MLERLFNLIQSDAFENELASMLDKFNSFDVLSKPLFNNVSKFTLNNGVYELSMDVEKGANANNVEINLDKKNILSVKYEMKTETSERMVNVKETLPFDADSDTIDAKIKDGKLIVTVNQKKAIKNDDIKIAINK